MPRRLRVLFVIGTMSGGGAERQVIEILRHLDRARFEPFLYLSSREGELLGEIPPDVPLFAFRSGMPESRFRKVCCRLQLAPLLRYLDLAGVLRRQKIDVIYDRTHHATLDAAGATWFRPTPRISCCVADPEIEVCQQANGRSNLVRRIARSAYHRASVVVANSAGLRQRLIEYFQLAPDRVRTCPNLVDFDRLTRLATEFVPDVPQEPFLIVTAGRLHPMKGHRYLVGAVDDLVHRRGHVVRLVVLGEGEARDELSQLIQSRNVSSHVTLAGFVANPLPWFRHARLCVLASLSEGLPNVLLEAAACGTPVLSTDCPSGPHEILEGGRLGTLVPPADSTALADAIEDAIDHYPDWQTRAALARESIRLRFDVHTGIRRLEELLENVAKQKPISRHRRWLSRLALVLFGSMLGVLIADRVVGILFQSSTRHLLRMPPNVSFRHRSAEFDYLFHSNSRGLRGPEIPFANPAGKFRIAVLGDSFVAGYGVPDDETMTVHLQRSFQQAPGQSGDEGVQVINLGRSGTSTVRELDLYELRGRPYHPDVVILVYFLGNDLCEVVQEQDRGELRAWRPTGTVRRIVHALCPNLYLELAMRKQDRETEQRFGPRTEQELLAALDVVARQYGADPMLVRERYLRVPQEVRHAIERGELSDWQIFPVLRQTRCAAKNECLANESELGDV